MKTSQLALSLCVAVFSSLANGQALSKKDFGFHYQFAPVDLENVKTPLTLMDIGNKDDKKLSSRPSPLATVTEERNTASSQTVRQADPYHRTFRTGFLSF